MGYLPGMIWLLAGVIALVPALIHMSELTRPHRDCHSVFGLVKEEMGPTAGVIALVQSRIHISEPIRPERSSYAVVCVKKRKIAV
ncbi:carbon starvation CstA family protein, partial [Escherichia coli]|uniref:carbon starvation CstA family protein n=1 Tax=Escherichia coli TaxID=562 RepID=UPI003CC7F67A